jgi:hypothetical protein
MAKTYTCKSCGVKSEKIGVVSEATQTLTLASDDWEDLTVDDTLYGSCLECGAKIPAKDLKRLTGESGKDYRAVLEDLVNDVETEGCDGCGTVSKAALNKARKALGYKND